MARRFPPSMADLKQLARRIFHQTLAAIDIPATMQRKLYVRGDGIALRHSSRWIARDLTRARRGDWKSRARDGGRAAACALPAGTSFGAWLVAPAPPARPYPGLKYFVGGHPIPNEQSWNAGEAILEMLAAMR